MNSTWLLLLDFDGTLIPIANTPDEAKLPQITKNLLQVLSCKKGVYVAIISGRRLSDIKKRVGLTNIIYGGNHGLEGEIFGEKYAFPIPNKICQDFLKIKKDLSQIANAFKGIFIEDKKLTLSFHYRMADQQQISEIKLLFHKALQPYIINKSIFIRQGNKVLDVMPNLKCNKGTFADLIIKRIKLITNRLPTIIAIGDETSDEDIFTDVQNSITVTIGKKEHSKAKYHLNSPRDTIIFLKELNNLV